MTLYPVPYRTHTLYVRVGDAILYRNEWMPLEPMTYVSAGVRAFTGCYVNHTAIVSIGRGGELVLVEALGRGLVERPLLEVLDRPNSTIVHRRDPRPYDEQAFADRLRGKVGCKYDYRNLILEQPPYRVQIMAAKVLDRATAGNLKLKPKWIGRTGDEAAKRLQCAEAWAWAKERDRYWLYSSREILEDPHLQTELFEMK